MQCQSLKLSQIWKARVPNGLPSSRRFSSPGNRSNPRSLSSPRLSMQLIRARSVTLASPPQLKERSQGTILLVGLLNGCFIFFADLLRELTIPYEVDFMAVSSYGREASSSGNVKMKKDISIDPFERHVVIVEDLIDTGNTLAWIRDHLASKQCASVRLCCLLDKSCRRLPHLKVDGASHLPIDFCGFDVPDHFVVGYGMDFAEQYRCLPYIAVLKPEAYIK